MKTLLVGYDGGVGQAIRKMSLGEDYVFYKGDLRKLPEFDIGEKPFNGIIYCAGINLISPFATVYRQQFIDSLLINCYGFAEIIQTLFEHDLLEPFSRACIITSNAANIPMTHSLSYNCSKAAANMMVRQLAREIPVEKLCIYGIAPNKLRDTPMSREIDKKVCALRGWTEEQAREYQLAALPAKQETEVTDLAEFIVDTYESPNFYPWVHGTILPFGGPQ